MKKRYCCDLDLKRSSKIFQTISEDSRLVIVCLLKEKERCVCEIQEVLGLPHNLVIHHLNKLKGVKMIGSRNQGKYTYYRLNRKVWGEFTDALEVLFGMKKTKGVSGHV